MKPKAHTGIGLASVMRAALLAGSALAMLATPAASETLEQALSRAYTANPTLNAQRASTRATDEGVPQALSGYRPRVFASGTAGATSTITRSDGFAGTVQAGAVPGTTVTTSANGKTRTDTLDGTVGASIEQPLFDGFRTKNSVRQAESAILAARETLTNTEQNVLFDAVSAYMNVLRDFAILDLRRNNVRLLGEELRQTGERFDVGEVTRTDVALSQSRQALARSELSVAEANLKASRAIYRQVIGAEPTRLFPARPIDRLLPRNLDRAIQTGISSHPAVLAALHAVDAANSQVRVIEGELLPSVSLEGNLQHQWQSGSSDISTSDGNRRIINGSVLGRLTVPIYQGGQEYSRVRESKEILGQRRIEADVVRDQVRAAIVSAWGSLEGARALIEAAQAQVAAGDAALGGTREEARVGQRTTLDVLNAQQELLNGRVTLITAQRDRVVASYALLQAIGSLNASTLNLRVSRYDPSIHAGQVRNKWVGTRTPDGR
jgi:outer membrane protein